jgi:YVTN family beta-propeller protein/autotransporter-associated beta strand protein
MRLQIEWGMAGSRGRARRRQFVSTARAFRTLALVLLSHLSWASPSWAQIDNYGLVTGVNSSPGQAAEFDTLTNAQVGSNVTTGDLPLNAVFSPDGRLAYVVNAGSNSVSVIDVVSRAVVTTISVGIQPSGLALSGDGQTLYVANSNGNSVSAISTATNTVVGVIPVGPQPVSVTISPDGTRLYVANEGGGTVSIINAATQTVIATVPVATSPSGITISPNGANIYVANQNSSNVSVINAASQTVVATISIPGGTAPLSVAVSPDGSRLYVTTQGNSVVVINAATNTVIADVALPNPSIGVTVTPDGARAYITSFNAIYILDATTDTIVGSVSNTVGNGNVGTGFLGPNIIVANGGPLSVANDAALTALGFGQHVDFNGGTLRFTGAFSSARTISLLAGGGTIDTNGFDATLSGQIINTGSLTKTGLGTLMLTGANTYTGGTFINAGTLALGGAGTLGDVGGSTAVNSGGTLDLGGTTQTQSVVALNGGTIKNGGLNAPIVSIGGTLDGIGGTAGLTTSAGTTMLLGTNSYAGATAVNGGVLEVDGSITGTSAVTVNAGGVLTGTGIVDPPTTTIASSGMLAPGNGTPGTSLAIDGNLAFQSGAIYMVAVNPSTASFATVTGTATLGGATVAAVFANGSFISKTYTILTANGGVSGIFASSVANTNLPSNFSDTLSYDATHAFLNLTLNFTPPSNPNFGGGLNINQQNVANTLTNFFNSTGGIPMVFGTLTPAGLTQASGELATGSQQATFDAMNLFMGLLTDPFVAGRGDGATSGASAPTGYASTQNTGAVRDTYAMLTKAPPAAFEQRWSVWAAGYGGSQTTDGNVSLGSNSTTSSVAGTVVGADYRISPYTLAGFALAGGGTSFSVVGSGSGHSDLFQAGAFIRHTVGPAYVSAALAYGWQDITTNRTVSVAGIDQLRAEFNANAFSGRLEGGYRFVSPWVGGIGITSYAAAQFTTFDLPAYAEQATVGSNAFALAYNAKDVTDARSELGIRTDKSWTMPGAILTLRGRFAWAHDFDPDRSIAATFQTLPGASFTVNGAPQAHDSALTTASVEMKWINGWSIAATFEGEFSNVTNSYAGKGVVRYQW